MDFTNKLNYKEEGHLITNEIIKAVVGGGYGKYTIKHHNVIEDSIKIYDDREYQGNNTVDFIVSKNEEKPWISEITITDTLYQTADNNLYLHYLTQGDENDADDINNLKTYIDDKKAPVMVARYIHSGNKVIQPTSVNLTTGVFTTTEPLNLTAGTKKLVMTVIKEHKNGILPREFNSVNAHAIEVIDSNSFYLLDGGVSGTRMTFPNVSNVSTVNVNLFRFEYDYNNNGVNMDISGLNLQHFKVVFTASRERANWTYIWVKANHEGGTWEDNMGVFTDGRDALSVYGEVEVRNYTNEKYMVARYLGGGSIVYNNGNGSWTRFSIANSGGNTFILNMKDVTFTNVRANFGMANDSIVEIYDLG